MMQASATVFTVQDIAASRDYFRDRMGFKVTFEWASLSYMSACSPTIFGCISARRATPGSCPVMAP
jgi:hypothetical protein